MLLFSCSEKNINYIKNCKEENYVSFVLNSIDNKKCRIERHIQTGLDEEIIFEESYYFSKFDSTVSDSNLLILYDGTYYRDSIVLEESQKLLELFKIYDPHVSHEEGYFKIFDHNDILIHVTNNWYVNFDLRNNVLEQVISSDEYVSSRVVYYFIVSHIYIGYDKYEIVDIEG